MLLPDEIPISGHGTYSVFNSSEFDEQPIGNKGKFEVPESPAEDSEIENGPIGKRINSKNWKTRSRAYEELTGLLDSADSELFIEHASAVHKYLADSHPGAQEKAFDVAKVFVKRNPELLLGFSESIVKVLVEKGMTSGKLLVKNETCSVISDFFAVHKDFEGFFAGVLYCINNKNVKVQAVGINTVTTLMSAFGGKKVPFKVFIYSIEKAAGASNPAVRSEALNFYKESFKWVRELLNPYVDKLKKAQQDELKLAFEEVKEVFLPSRYLKSEEHLAKTQKSEGKSMRLDVYDMAEAKDIFAKYNEKWVNTVLAFEKWTDKKKALEELNGDANYPKLAEKSPIDLVTLAKRLVNDSNLQVMLQAIRLVGLLAKGQRKYFDSFGRQFFPIIIQKFKDKKTQVLTEAQSCLDHLLYSFSFDSVLEDVRSALEDANPLIKANTGLWIEKIIETGQADLKNSIKSLVGLCKKNTDDSSPEVRTSAFKLLSSLLKKYPDSVQVLIRDLPAAKMKKLEDSEKPEEKKVKIEEKEEKKEPKTPQAKKTPSKEPAKTGQKNEDEDFNSALTAEEAENIISSIVPGDILRQLKDNAWKEKQSGLSGLYKWSQENFDLVSKHNEAILRFVKLTVKDWKENNFNVVKAAFELYKLVNESCFISKKSAFGALNPAALDKLSDSKLVDLYSSLIFSFSETLGPKFVVFCLIKGTSDCSKPKVVSESFTCISKIINEFGIHSVNLKEVIDYSKTGLNQANPAIKKPAHSLITIVYSFLGDKLIPLLTDIKDSTLKVLQEEFAKTPLVTKVVFKQFKGQEELKIDPKKALDEVLPRTNIEKLIGPSLIKKFTDANWKVRKEALDEFEGIIDSSGGRILPCGLESVVKCLVGRITDPNKAVVRQVLGLSGKFAAALGSDCKGFVKAFVPTIISCLADKQNLLRQDAMIAVNKWSEEAGPDIIINLTVGPLLTDNPELRSELLKWLIDHKESFKLIDAKIFVPSVLACLQDRSASIRNLAELFFAEIVEIIGFECFQPSLKDIKPAVLNTLTPVFDKYRLKTETPDVALPTKPVRSSGSVVQERSGSKEFIRKKTSIGFRGVEELKSPIKKSKTVIFSSLEISLVSTGNKEKRLEAESKNKWSVEDLRPDYFERTKDQVKSTFSPDLFVLLFNSDFKKQVEGLAHLQTLFVSNKKEVTEVLDIIFKWTWLTLQLNANTQLHKAIFEMIQVLINLLAEIQYVLLEAEAYLFFPIVCEKSGNATFKGIIKGIIHNSTLIYPAEKVFAFVLIGCNSKNSKAKVECLEELASLVQDFGISITQVKDIKAIVKHANSPDNNVRTAAIQTLGEIYKLAGDKTWTMIGEVSDKVRDLLDQRFKSVSNLAQPTGRRSSMRDSLPKPILPKQSRSKNPDDRVSTPLSPRNLGGHTERNSNISPIKLLKSQKSQKESSKPNLSLTLKKNPEEFKDPSPLLDLSKRAGLIEHRNLSHIENRSSDFQDRSKDLSLNQSTELFNKRQVKLASFEDKLNDNLIIQKSEFLNNKRTADIPVVDDDNEILTEESMLYDSFKIDEFGPSELDKNLEILKNGDISSRVDALVALNDLILNNLEQNKEEVQTKANNISEAMIKVIISTFERPIEDIPLRFAKYFLNVLHKVCSTKVIIRELTESNLYTLVEQVLTRLLIEELEKVGEKGEGEMMLKTLNGSMLRLLEHSAASKITIVLIRLLSKYRSPLKLIKMPSMITRCLMKIIKSLQSIILQLEVGKILVAIHEYLIQIKNIASEDLGVKTFKTFVVEIVKIQGNGVWQNYDWVRQHHAPDLLIEKWIFSALNLTTNPFVDPPKNKLDPSMLDIIELIKLDYTAGVQKLSVQLEKSPEIDLSVYLKLCSDQLAGRILEGLRETKKNSQAKEENMVAGYNFQDFQKRLSVMKQKYGITNNTLPVEINSTLNDLKSKVNNLLNKPPVPDEQDFVNDLRNRIQNLNRVNK